MSYMRAAIGVLFGVFLLCCSSAVSQSGDRAADEGPSRRINGPRAGSGEIEGGDPKQLAIGGTIRALSQKVPQQEGFLFFKAQLKILDTYLHRYSKEPDMVNAEEVARRRYITGCIDFASIFGSMLRARGYKTRYIHGVDIEWLRQTQAGQRPRTYKGHAFVQVWAEDRWQLIDAPAGRLYPDCPLENKVLPRGYLLQFRGPDLWSFGIRDIRDLHEAMRVYAKTAVIPANTKSGCVGIKLREKGQFRHPMQ